MGRKRLAHGSRFVEAVDKPTGKSEQAGADKHTMDGLVCRAHGAMAGHSR